jgi:AcrR family transcriptional regulator
VSGCTLAPVPGKGKINRGPSAGPENRRALIAAAREIFATAGYNAPLNAVAKRAGVGQGSLYRHFPTRTALAVAVFDENMTALEAVASDPDATVDVLLDRVVEQALVSTAFIDMLNADQLGEGTVQLGERLAAIVAELLARDQAAGRVGMHVETADALLAIEMLADLLARTPIDRRAAAASRARALFDAAFA